MKFRKFKAYQNFHQIQGLSKDQNKFKATPCGLHNFSRSVLPLLSKDQFGFRKFYSTADQLLITYNEVTVFLDRGMSIDLKFICDFAKAFDTVRHRALLFKLFNLSLHGNILSWIHGLLTNRTMSVKVAGFFND